METKEFNLCEILKNAPKGLKLWCDVFGEVELKEICDENVYYPIVCLKNALTISFIKNGSYVNDGLPVLWPSKDVRTWDNWQQHLFKKGDIITNEKTGSTFMYFGQISCMKSDGDVMTILNLGVLRYATPEEKDKFIKDVSKYDYVYDEVSKDLREADYTGDDSDVSEKSRPYVSEKNFHDGMIKIVDLNEKQYSVIMNLINTWQE